MTTTSLTDDRPEAAGLLTGAAAIGNQQWRVSQKAVQPFSRCQGEESTRWTCSP